MKNIEQKESVQTLNEYDRINTSAVCWLKWDSSSHKKELGIDNINNSASCKWLFYAFYNYSILTNSLYYTRNLFSFLYYFLIKKHKNIRLTLIKKENIFWIDALCFITEIETLSDNPHITEKIYNCYYRR